MKHILDDIESLTNGSRFYRCAFQVNTYEYVKRHNRETSFADEHNAKKGVGVIFYVSQYSAASNG
jgi:hypothetical protein